MGGDDFTGVVDGGGDGDIDSNADDEDEEEDASLFETGLTLEDSISYTDYGNGDGDGCEESNTLYTGWTVCISPLLIKKGTFCQKDIVEVNTTVYTKIQVTS